MVRRVAAVEGDEMVSDDAEEEGFRIPQVGSHLGGKEGLWVWWALRAAETDYVTRSAVHAYVVKAWVRMLAFWQL